MKYSLKQAWFNLDNGFTIIDEKGREAFRVAGRAAMGTPPAPGEKLSFRDRDDTELAFISTKLLSSGPAYEIYHGDDLQAVVKRDALTGKICQFRAEGPSPDDLHAEGNFSGREYTFTREGKPVGRVSKGFFATNGTYGVEVGRGEDEVLLLASAVVIDLCCHQKGK
jgi:uncharacterized protein YxjI